MKRWLTQQLGDIKPHIKRSNCQWMCVAGKSNLFAIGSTPDEAYCLWVWFHIMKTRQV